MSRYPDFDRPEWQGSEQAVTRLQRALGGGRGGRDRLCYLDRNRSGDQASPRWETSHGGRRPDRPLEDAPTMPRPHLARLRASHETAQADFYVRSHGDVPEVEAETYILEVSGLVATPLRLGLDDLRRFPQVTLAATMQCAGNRRRRPGRAEARRRRSVGRPAPSAMPAGPACASPTSCGLRGSKRQRSLARLGTSPSPRSTRSRWRASISPTAPRSRSGRRWRRRCCWPPP